MFDHLRGFLAQPSNEAVSNEAPNINEKVILLIANIVQDASGEVFLCKEKSFVLPVPKDFCRSAWPGPGVRMCLQSQTF